MPANWKTQQWPQDWKKSVFLPKSKCLLISWLQSPSAVILEPPKIKSATVSTVSPSISHEVMGLDAKVLHSICQQIWKTQQWPQDWKSSVFIPIAKKGNAKECSNYRTIALISHASKVMLKILQVRLQQYMNRELPDVQAGFPALLIDKLSSSLFTLSSFLKFKMPIGAQIYQEAGQVV